MQPSGEIAVLKDVAAATERAWCALYTRHQHEKLAARLLAHKGFEIFLPLYATTHRWKDRLKHLVLPLFPGYVFLRGGLDRPLEILNTPGVCFLVGTGGRPCAIPEAEIEAVRQVLQQHFRVEPHPYLRCGDRVRVEFGPLQGLEGILVRTKDQSGRLILSVELLQRSVAVEVDLSMVEPVPKSALAITANALRLPCPTYA